MEQVNAESRKERDRRLRENDFLAAAEKLFSEKGYAETSMEDVAAEAEYATGTIYRYFESKQALYQSLLLRKGSLYVDLVSSVLKQDGDPVELLKTLIREKITFFYEHNSFMRIYLTEVAGHGSGAPCHPPAELQAKFKELQAAFELVIKRGIKKGCFKKMDPGLAVTAWIGLTNEVLFKGLREESGPSREEIENFLIVSLDYLILKKGASV